MAKAIVYVLVNEAMPGYIKIGKTDNIEQRVRSLDTTGLPLPFSCFFAAEVEDADRVERRLHEAFSDHRVRSNREFFQLSPERVVSAIGIGDYRDITPGKDFVETDEDQRALNRSRERKSVFNFEMVGIKPGSILTFTRDPNITCAVVDRRKVMFNGEIMSVSLAADKALQAQGHKWMGVQGPLYWEYERETLDERRTRLEESTDDDDESYPAYEIVVVKEEE